MDIKFFNDDFSMSPAEYAKALFENTNENMLTLSRRNEDPLSGDYDKQHFESYTMEWNKKDLEEVIDDFEILYSELENGTEEYGADYAIECLNLVLDSEMTDCRARRVCKLIELSAPVVVINFEACKLMDAMIIARYAISMDYSFCFADDFKVA